MSWLSYIWISLLLHFIDDFCLQIHSLSKFKQKHWWEIICRENKLDFKKYRFDYIMSLLIHSFEWSIMISLPLLIMGYNDMKLLSYIIVGNALIHCIVDDLKCNKMKINLVVDQTIHILQVIGMYYILYLFTI